MKKKIDFETKIWKFVDNHLDLIIFLLITIFSLIVRYLLIKYPSGDYDMFLKNWFNDLKSYGGLKGLGYSIGNYTPPYMTILALLTYLPLDSLISIKMISIVFDYIAGITIIKIIEELFQDKKYNKKIALIFYTLFLFLPTVFLNSAYWAQCDIIYTTFILISILYLLKNKYIKGLIFWSIAFAFKFQAILIFPLYVLIYISNRKLKFKYFFIIPIVIFLLSIPKIYFSHDLLEGFKVYLNQSSAYSQFLTLNFPNFYSIYFIGSFGNNPNLIQTPIPEFGTIGMIIMFIIFVVIAYLVYIKKIKFDKKSIIEFGLWSILIATFFLPQMHERYLFMGDVMGIIYLLINKKKYYIPIAIELISLNGYMYLLFSGFAINFSMLSIFYLVILILYTKDMYQKYFKFT